MAFDPVPWFVEGGASHSAEVARLIAFLATGGQEGVVNSGDLKVLELEIPGTAVRVQSGACVIRNRAIGQENGSYVGRVAVEETLNISATSTMAARSDLIIARVENPHISGEPWQLPMDSTEGPYVFLRVIENVPNDTVSVHSLDLGYSAIALARIDMPPSTGTVTQDMIADLRSICNPITGPQPPPVSPPTEGGGGDAPGEVDERCPVVVIPCDGDDGNNDDGDPLTYTQTEYFNWPAPAVFNLKIPNWATHMDVTIEVLNCQLRHGSLGGYLRLLIANTPMFERTFRVDYPNGTVRANVPMHVSNLYIPVNMRARTLEWRIQARVHLGFLIGLLLATDSTNVKVTVTFKQKAE